MSSARLPASSTLDAITPASATPRTDPRTPIHPAITTAITTNQPALRAAAIAYPPPHVIVRKKRRSLFFALWQISRDQVNPAPRLLENADRHHDHRLAGEHELFLGQERRLVVEQLVEEVLLLEDELPGEEDDVREIGRHLRRHPLQHLDDVRAHPVPRLRVVPVPLHELDVVRKLSAQVLREVLDLRHPLEAAGVDHPHGQQHEVPERSRERTDDREEDVHPQAVVPGHQDGGSRSLPPRSEEHTSEL